MAVKDRTRRRLPRLGIIRLGIKVPNKSGNGTHPEQAGRFILRDAPEIAEFYAGQGIDEVREMDVLLPFPDIERNFSAFYQVWAGGVLVCKGDGEYVQYATPFTTKIDKKGTHVHTASGDTQVNDGVAQIAFDWNGEHFNAGDLVPCPGKRFDFYPHCAACRLNCLLKVSMADPDLFRFGYYQISTQGTRNHDTIMGTLEMMPIDCVNGVPFKLRMVEEKTTYNDKGTRKKGKKWFLQLEPDPEITRKLYQRRISRMIDAPPERAALPETTLEWNEAGDDGVYDADPPAPPPFAEVQVQGADALEDTAPAHVWTKEEARSLSFWAYERAIGKADVIKALGIEKVSDYAGNLDSAKKRIDAWILEQAKAQIGEVGDATIPES